MTKGGRHCQQELARSLSCHYLFRTGFVTVLLVLRSPPPSTDPKTPKTRKASKKSPERSLGPPDPGPQKVRKKVRKVKKIVDFQRLFDLFFDFFGVRGRGGPKLLSGDFFETFRVFGVWGSADGKGDLNPCAEIHLRTT